MTNPTFHNRYELHSFDEAESEASPQMDALEWNRCCPPCPCPPHPLPPVFGINAYAQYVITGSPDSGGYLSFYPQFEEGNLTFSNNDVIRLSSGFIYLVNYVTQATPEANQYYQLVPYINGQPRLNYSSIGTAAATFRNASAAGSFLVEESSEDDVTLQIQVTYPEATNHIDVSGIFSILPIAAKRMVYSQTGR